MSGMIPGLVGIPGMTRIQTNTTRVAARAKKMRNRAPRKLIPGDLRRMRAYPAAAVRRGAKTGIGETWKNAADPALTGSKRAP